MSTSLPMRPCTERLIGALMMVCMLGGTGCGPRDSASSPHPAAPRAVTLLYTCDTQGYIFPCDCEGGAEGGIARRARFVGAQPAANRLLVDAGNFVAGARDWEVLQARYLLRGYALMRYDAVNLGHREAGLGVEALKTLRTEFPRLVSANLLDAAGKPVVDPYVVVTLSDGTRVGIIGLMDDHLPVRERGPGLTIAPPDNALGRYLPEVRKQSDVVVVLAFADEEALLNLANLFYEVSVIVGGRVPQPTATPWTMNQAIVVAVTDKGKRIGRLDLDLSRHPAGVRTNVITALNASFADDPAAAGIQRDYQAALKEKDFVSRRSFVDDSEGLSVIDAHQPKESQP